MATDELKEADYSESLGSEDLCEVVCDPCQEDGELHEAVGMCVDCQDYLCQRCFNGHKIGRAYRKHELLNKDDMVSGHVFSRKDKRTDKCDEHEDESIQYYCKDHCKLGCGVCMTLEHRSCENVTYIPHAAMDLDNDVAYKTAECYLNSVAERYKKFTEDYKQKSESLELDYSQAVKMVHEFRIQINDALNKIETDLVETCEQLKSAATAKMTQFEGKLKRMQTALHALMATKEKHQNKNQNSKLYIVMMKANDKLKAAEDMIKEAETGHALINGQIKFISNNETLINLKHPEALGKLLVSEISTASRTEEEKTFRRTETKVSDKRRESGAVVRGEYVRDIDVKSNSDNRTCCISSLIVLPDNRLLIADQNTYWQLGNGNVKLLSARHDQVISHLTLSSGPWDVTLINNSLAAVTVPDDKKVVIVNVAATTLTVDRTLDVDGQCMGLDYRDDKLAVSFKDPDKVQVITLQGQVLHIITSGQLCSPYYVVFGRDITSIFVSNCDRQNVAHVEFDGTILDTYTHSQLIRPRALLADSNGSVYICGEYSGNIHQITTDCMESRVLLTESDGLNRPRSICYSETEGMLYVGMWNNNVVKVYNCIND